MTESMWIRSHVERCLQQVWQVLDLEVDSDDDYPFRNGSAACWVHLIEGDVPMVRVFAHAAFGVKKSTKLLEELNSIQLRALSATVEFMPEGVVIVKQTISPVGLTPSVLSQAMAAVGGIASDIGPLIAGMFGGGTPFRPEFDTADEEAA